MKIIQRISVILVCLNSLPQLGMQIEIPYMLVSTTDGIIHINMDDTKNYHYLVKEFGISAFDYHYKKNLLFWANELVPAIKVTTLNKKSEITDIYTFEKNSPTGVSVDWLHDRVYWVEQNNRVIKAYDINTETISVVLKLSSFSSPTKLKILPHLEFLFWGDKYKRGIQRYSITNNGGEILQILKGVSCPDALALNYETGSLYIIDACKTSLHTIKFDGSGKKTILRKVPGGTLVTGIYWFNDSLFWTMQSDSATVRYIEMTDKSNMEYFQLHYNIFTDIAVVHPSNQPSGEELQYHSCGGTICYHGNCTTDGHCQCKRGWQGSDCSSPDRNEYRRKVEECEEICENVSGVYHCKCEVRNDILDDQPTIEPDDQPTSRLEDQHTNGQEDLPTSGLEYQFTSQQEDQPTSRPEDQPTSRPEDLPTSGQEYRSTSQQVNQPMSGAYQPTSEPTYQTTSNSSPNDILDHDSNDPTTVYPTSQTFSQWKFETGDPHQAKIETDLEISPTIVPQSHTQGDLVTHDSDTSTAVGRERGTTMNKVETSKENWSTRDSTTIPSNNVDELSQTHTNNDRKLTSEMMAAVSTDQRLLLGKLNGMKEDMIIFISLSAAVVVLIAFFFCALLLFLLWKQYHSGTYSIHCHPYNKGSNKRTFLKCHNNCEGGDQTSQISFKGITWTRDHFSRQDQIFPADIASAKKEEGHISEANQVYF